MRSFERQGTSVCELLPLLERMIPSLFRTDLYVIETIVIGDQDQVIQRGYRPRESNATLTWPLSGSGFTALACLALTPPTILALQINTKHDHTIRSLEGVKPSFDVGRNPVDGIRLVMLHQMDPAT